MSVSILLLLGEQNRTICSTSFTNFRQVLEMTEASRWYQKHSPNFKYHSSKYHFAKQILLPQDFDQYNKFCVALQYSKLMLNPFIHVKRWPNILQKYFWKRFLFGNFSTLWMTWLSYRLSSHLAISIEL